MNYFSRASFAVVGHPNKGKSSIVSTLARNDAIEISSASGTTVKTQKYRVDTGRGGFELIDTPGFQRPTKVLKWLKQRASQADQRRAAIQAFVANPQCAQDFPDEVELLTPLVEGAAILYVVDGSRPYGAEYESEMEILRWTGQPSMALINPIGSSAHISDWQNALAQYFKIVRVFNPMDAGVEKQKALFGAFAHLEPKWAANISQVIEDLEAIDQQLYVRGAQILSELLVDLCSYQYQQKTLTQEQAKKLTSMVKAGFKNWITVREKQAFNELKSLFSFSELALAADSIAVPEDLFNQQAWFAWGLNKKQLLVASALTGAASGAAVDLAVAGHSFMLGAVGGGIAGLTGALFGAERLAKSKIKGLPLGGYQAVYGPINNANFPYVVIGRFMFLFEQLKNKNHADRKEINVSTSILQNKIEQMQKNDSKQLHKVCRDLVAQKTVSQLNQVLLDLLTLS